MIFTVLEQHKLMFKRWLVSNKNQLECQGRSALLSVQFTLDKTADFFVQKFVVITPPLELAVRFLSPDTDRQRRNSRRRLRNR